MKTFNLIAKVTISLYTTVKAKTLEEAIIIAQDRDIESSEFGRSTDQAKQAWISDEFDGTPTDIQEV